MPGIQVGQVHLEMVPEHPAHALRLPFPENSVVDEHATQLGTDGVVEEDRHHRRIDPSAQGTDHVIRADLLHQAAGDRLHKGLHGPAGTAAAYAVEKILQEGLAAGRVDHFRVKLDAVKAALGVGHGGNGGIGTACQNPEPRRKLEDPVPVAHPDPHAFGLDVPEELRGVLDLDQGMTVFPPIGPFHGPSQLPGHELHSVADTQDGDAQAKEAGIGKRGVQIVNPGGSSRKENPLGPKGADLFQRQVEGMNLAIDVTLPHPPGNELGVLGTEVEDEDTVLMKRVDRHDIVPWQGTPTKWECYFRSTW